MSDGQNKPELLWELFGPKRIASTCQDCGTSSTEYGIISAYITRDMKDILLCSECREKMLIAEYLRSDEDQS